MDEHLSVIDGSFDNSPDLDELPSYSNVTIQEFMNDIGLGFWDIEVDAERSNVISQGKSHLSIQPHRR